MHKSYIGMHKLYICETLAGVAGFAGAAGGVVAIEEFAGDNQIGEDLALHRVRVHFVQHEYVRLIGH